MTEGPLSRVILPNGQVDWEAFHELVRDKDFLVYDPPQKKRSFFTCSNINLFTPRSPYGVGFPCCLAESIRSCIRLRYDVQDAYISKPDEWFLKMMEPPAEGNFCPEILRGVLWMQDNIANETLLSLESAHWAPWDSKWAGVGVKHILHNWTRGSSLWGTVLTRVHESMWPCFQLSPDWQWVALDVDNWIYILQAEDKLVDVKGNPVPFVPGDDFLRVTWNDRDPKKGLYYQYLVRRVARKDENGKLQKVQPAFDELLDRATRPTVQGVCCNLFLCNISDEDYGSAYDSIDDHQLLVPGPEVEIWHPWKEGDGKDAMPPSDNVMTSLLRQ